MMNEDITDDGFEMDEPEGFMEPKVYRARFLCSRCNKIFYSPWLKAPPKKIYPCPRIKCREAAAAEAALADNRRFSAIAESGKPPGHIGDKTIVKAVDETARIVMEDHKMTNLRDGIRQGESVAPKLPPMLQASADNYFSGQSPGLNMGGAGIRRNRLQQLAARAVRGQFAADAFNPATLIGGRPGDPAMRLVRTERA